MARLVPSVLFSVAALSAQAQPLPAPAPLDLPNVRLEVAGKVNALAVQSDGDVVVGGRFSSINGVPRNNLALVRADGTVEPDWNPAPDGEVLEVAIGPGDAVFAAGYFDAAGGAQRPRLVKLAGNGFGAAVTAFAPALTDPRIESLLADATGALYVGGVYFRPDGSAAHLAKLSGTTGASDPAWAGAPQPNDDVLALALDASGLYVGGTFQSVGGVTRRALAKLVPANGTLAAWNPDPANTPGLGVSVAALELEGASIYVGGFYTTIGTAAGRSTRRHVAKLDAISGGVVPTWDAAANGGVNVLERFDGALHVGGNFSSIGGLARSRVARLSLANGTADAAFGTTLGGDVFTPVVAAIAPMAGRVLVGGDFISIDGEQRPGLGFAGSGVAGTPPRLDAGLAGSVDAFVAVPDGGWIVGGDFIAADGLPRRHLARITALGAIDPNWRADLDGATGGSVAAIALNPNTFAADGARVVVGGDFESVNGAPARALARVSLTTGALDASWGTQVDEAVSALGYDPNQRLYVAGAFTQVTQSGVDVPRHGVARFSNAGLLDPQWVPPASDSAPTSMAIDNGVVLGGFGWLRKLSAASDASSTPAVVFEHTVAGEVGALALGTNALYAGGDFVAIGTTSVGAVARLDRTTGEVDGAFDADLSHLDRVAALAVAGDGSVFVGGASVFGPSTSDARFLVHLSATGARTAAFTPQPNQSVRALGIVAGQLVAAGGFDRVGGAVRSGFAVLDKLAQAPLVAQATPGSIETGATSALSTTGGSGTGAVTYTVSAGSGSCARSGSTITGATPGTCTVTATRAGDAVYAAATATVDIVVTGPNADVLFRDGFEN